MFYFYFVLVLLQVLKRIPIKSLADHYANGTNNSMTTHNKEYNLYKISLEKSLSTQPAAPYNKQ